MTGFLLIALVALLAVGGYGLGKAKARAIAAAGNTMRSRPSHHGLLVALWCGVPAGGLALTWLAFDFMPATLVSPRFLWRCFRWRWRDWHTAGRALGRREKPGCSWKPSCGSFWPVPRRWQS